MAYYYSAKEEEIVAYDYDTNLKHSSYKNLEIAARFFDVKQKEIAASIRDNSVIVEGMYFKVQARTSFKPKPSII
jgi:hypothetical protein